MKNHKLRCGEIALLLALAVTLLWGSWSLQEQDALERKMIRLHVIANSETQADQTLKLQVRDRVLAQATAILEQARDMEDAEIQLTAALPEIEDAARAEMAERGYDYAVSARLEQTEFPTKVYDGFALPSGSYLALRVVIGEGQGQNWWCVVFPPLCGAAGLAEAEVQCLSDDQLAIIGETEAGYVLKFRILELWGELMNKFDGHAW